MAMMAGLIAFAPDIDLQCLHPGAPEQLAVFNQFLFEKYHLSLTIHSPNSYSIPMKLQDLTIGMKVRHPQYGEGVVKAVTEHAADIRFPDELRKISPEASGLEPAEPQAALQGLNIPLNRLIDQVVTATLQELGVENPNSVIEELGVRWLRGTLVMRPSDPALQAKDVPIETFFHKIVMMRNNFRVLEQKINAHPTMSEAEKIDLQQYISKCYGSMTTFNILFKTESGQFRSK